MFWILRRTGAANFFNSLNNNCSFSKGNGNGGAAGGNGNHSNSTQGKFPMANAACPGANYIIVFRAQGGNWLGCLISETWLSLKTDAQINA